MQPAASCPAPPVTITNTATNIQRTLTTNSSGAYDAPALPPGSYSLKVSMPGFKTDVRNSIELQIDQTARINFSLQVGNVSETLEATRPLPSSIRKMPP